MTVRSSWCKLQEEFISERSFYTITTHNLLDMTRKVLNDNVFFLKLSKLFSSSTIMKKSFRCSMDIYAYFATLMLPLHTRPFFLHRSVFRLLLFLRQNFQDCFSRVSWIWSFASSLLLFDFVFSKLVARSQELHGIRDIQIKIGLISRKSWETDCGKDLDSSLLIFNCEDFGASLISLYNYQITIRTKDFRETTILIIYPQTQQWSQKSKDEHLKGYNKG